MNNWPARRGVDSCAVGEYLRLTDLALEAGMSEGAHNVGVVQV